MGFSSLSGLDKIGKWKEKCNSIRSSAWSEKINKIQWKIILKSSLSWESFEKKYQLVFGLVVFVFSWLEEVSSLIHMDDEDNIYLWSIQYLVVSVLASYIGLLAHYNWSIEKLTIYISPFLSFPKWVFLKKKKKRVKRKG